MLVSYFGELSTELRPVFPAVLLRVSKLNMIRIDELYWKTPQGYQIFIYRSSGNHKSNDCSSALVGFYHINGALETALCMPSPSKVGLGCFFSLDHIIFGNY